MYIAVWESQRPSPLALQKDDQLFEVLCVRYVALRSGSVSQTTMLLRLSRPYSYDPRPISKKPKKSDILTSWRVNPKGNNKIEIRNLLNEHDASIKENTELAKGEWTGDRMWCKCRKEGVCR